MNIETHQVDPGYHSYQLEPHYVQLLLYYGVLQHNFKLSNDRVNIRLLYSEVSAARRTDGSSVLPQALPGSHHLPQPAGSRFFRNSQGRF